MVRPILALCLALSLTGVQAAPRRPSLPAPRASNVGATLLESAARTTATNSSDQVNRAGRGVIVFLNVTVASGTGGLTLRIQSKAAGAYVSLNAAPTAVTATGQTVYVFYPGAGTAAGGVTQSTSQPLPLSWRVAVAVGDASSYTYSVEAHVIQ